MPQNFLKKNRRFIYPQEISQHLQCAICHEIFYDPVRTICGHTFCYLCIQSWRVITKKCPICKSKISQRKLEKDRIPSLIIDDLEVKCHYLKCDWKGVHSSLRRHLRLCEYREKKKNQSNNSGSDLQVVNVENQSIDEVTIINKKVFNEIQIDIII